MGEVFHRREGVFGYQAGCPGIPGLPSRTSFYNTDGPLGAGVAGPGQGEQWTTDEMEPLAATLPVHSAIPPGEEDRKC